jgi:hypothetical protein
MATSVLTNTYLNFNNGVTQYARFTASADTLNLTGAGGANTVKLSNLTNPTAAQDAATKNYVDSVANGLVWKSPVTACSYGLGNLTLSAPQTVDGVALIAGNRILVADQTLPVENGIYVVAAGAWTRATDMPAGSDAASNAVFCQQGTANADNGFVCTNDTGSAVVGTNPLTFIIFTNIVPAVPGAPANSLQYNNGGVFGGMSNWETADNGVTISGTAATLSLDNTSQLNIGNTTVSYDSSPQALKFFAPGANNETRFYGDVGYDFYVSDNSVGYTTFFRFNSDTGLATVTGGLSIPTDSTNLSIGSTGQLTAQFNGTNSVVSTSTGNLNLQAAGVTSDVVALLGTTTNATSFQVQDSANVAALTVYGSADTVAAAQLTVQGELSKYTNTTTVNTAADVTYTAAQMFGGLILRDPNGANRNDTTDTATNIVGSIVDPVVGSSYEFVVNNTAAVAENITVVAGTGVTLVGTMTINQFELRHFLVIVTNVGTPAVTIYDNGVSSSTTTVSAAGADTEIQYNNGGTLGAVSSFAFNKSNTVPVLDVGANVATTAATINVGTGGTNTDATILLGNGTGNTLINAQSTGIFYVQGAGDVTILTTGGNATLTANVGNANVLGTAVDITASASDVIVTGATNTSITATAGTANVTAGADVIVASGTTTTITAGTNASMTATAGNVNVTASTDATMTATVGDANVTAGTNATMTAGGTATVTSTNDTNVTAGTNIAVTGGNNVTVTATTGTVNTTGATGATVTATVGNVSLDATAGQVDITGNTNVNMTATTGAASITATAGTVTLTAGVDAVTTATGDASMTAGGTAILTGNSVAITSNGAATNIIATLGDAAGATEFRVNDSANVTQFKVDSDGKGTFTGDAYANAFFTTSDATLKANITPLEDSLSMIKNLEGYQYNWKDEDASQELQYGVLAQQLEEVGLEHLVSQNNGHKTVNYLGLIPILIEAVKELSLKLDKQSREQKQSRLGK